MVLLLHSSLRWRNLSPNLELFIEINLHYPPTPRIADAGNVETVPAGPPLHPTVNRPLLRYR